MQLAPMGALVLLAPLARAQVVRTQARCDGQIVSDIIIRSQGPSFGGVIQKTPIVSTVIRDLHVTTDPDLVGRYVLLEKGKPCSATLRAETERILLAQPFLAEASVTAYDDGRGGVRIEVVTVDEVSAIGSMAVAGRSPYVTGLSLGSANLDGAGIYAVASWRDGGGFRDAFGGKIVDYQLFGRPIVWSAVANRAELGGEWHTELTRPFYTDYQHAAWIGSLGSSREYFGLVRMPGAWTNVIVDRMYSDVGGVFRVGNPGRLGLYGASISHEDANPQATPVFVGEQDVTPDTISGLVGRYSRVRTTRVNLLMGARRLHFVRVNGFDALSNQQDVRTGFQLGTVVGRSLPVLGSTDDDVVLSLDLYAGRGGPSSFIAMDVRGVGRRNLDRGEWDDVLTSGRGAWYSKTGGGRTTILSAEWTGGWHAQTPFQLTLGDTRGGLRGYDPARFPGARRGVLRGEQRWLLSNVGGNADLGGGFFAEAGRMWAGDAPFGVTTPLEASLGTSLLAAVPPHSQRMWRLDVAFPLTHNAGRSVELRLTNDDRTRLFWREPNDLQRSRERSLPTGIFSWP
jgi:hypothetical protein